MSSLRSGDRAESRSTGSVALARRQTDYWLTVFRRTWRGTIVTSFLNPLLYVLSMGLLLGTYVDSDPARLEGATSYLAFIAPGLVAAQSMQSAVGDTTYPVMGALKWNRVYFGMNATPLRPVDIVNANFGFVLARLMLVCGVFMLVMAPFGVFVSVIGGVLAWAASVLVGLAIGAAVYAFSVGVTNEWSFGLIFRLGVIPQFLFSGAFFPVGNLSPVLEWVAKATPLWHGVDLTRMFCLGTFDLVPALGHLAYLAALLAGSHVLSVRRLARRLAA